MNEPPDPILAVTIAIPALSVTVVGLVAHRVWHVVSARTALTFVGLMVAWAGLTGALAASGALADMDRRPPPLALLMPAVLVVALALGLSRPGGVLADQTPLAALIGLQAFRLPLEITMHDAALAGLMPVELSWSGENFDVVTGAGAVVIVIVAAAIGRVPVALAWVWNVVGIAALVSIVRVAILSSPMLRAYGDDPAHINWWVTRVPYVWLPVILVVVAAAGHVVLTRALLKR